MVVLGSALFILGAIGLLALLAAVDTAAPADLTLGGLDLDLACEAIHGGVRSPVQIAPNAGGWRCATDDAEPAVIDFGQACVLLYGPNVGARLIDWSDAGGWECFVDDPGELTLGGYAHRAREPQCPFDPGVYLADGYQDFARYSQTSSEAFQAAGGVEEIGCPEGPMFRRGAGVVQEPGRNGTTTGAIFSIDANGAVVLTGGAWQSYVRFGAGQGASLLLMGFPLSPPTRTSGG